VFKVTLCEVLLPWVLCESRVFPGCDPLKLLLRLGPLTWRSETAGRLGWWGGFTTTKLPPLPLLEVAPFQLPLLPLYHTFL
jgi:hypothetical protein